MSATQRDAQITADDDRDGLLPGAPIIAGIRSLVIWGVVAAAILGMFVHGTHESCSGGLASDGEGYIGADGKPTDIEPICGTVTMSPSPLVFAILAIIVVTALTRVLGRATDVDHALRILNNARMVIVVVALTGLVVGWWAIMTLRIDDWSAFSVWSPLPFGQFEVETHPISQR
ncbi:hypothetical protein [Microbacterium sp. S1037]|uniref:hypothetical protein n=1 Tax=Microbacterium sp. S1037 TaxID=3398227 RepID=UPI003AAE0AE3